MEQAKLGKGLGGFISPEANESYIRIELTRLKNEMDELSLIVHGNEALDLPGIRKRLRIAERELYQLTAERKRQTLWLKIIGLCVAILAISMVALATSQLWIP